MAKRNDTSTARARRNRAKQAADRAADSAAPDLPEDVADDDDDSLPALFDNPLEEAIEAERAHLLQAHAALKCLHEVLLYLDDENATLYADVADLAAKMVNESVTRLDCVRLGPMIEALQRGRDYEAREEDMGIGHRGKDEVREVARPMYLC